MVLLVFAFLVVLALAFTVVLVATRPSRTSNALQTRLSHIRNPRRSLNDETSDLGFDVVQRPTLSGRIGVYLQQYPFATGLRILIMHAHSRWTVGSFALYTLSAAVASAVLCALVQPGVLLEILAALLGSCLPYLWLRQRSSSRLGAFNKRLPDAIDMMARALRAGHSIQQTFEFIAEQSTEPLSTEFAQINQEQRFGIPFRDALVQMSDRIPSQDMHFVITAILVQKETGGDLIEILDRTTEVIRDRMRVQGEIRVYTAQGRLTGWILSALPVVLLAIISLVSPGYTSLLFHDPVGHLLLIGGGVMIVIGCLIIRKIVDVEV